jgi:CheY-like chemotaxis protein
MNRILNVTETPKGIIILVDNDKNEHRHLQEVMEELGIKNKLKSFYNGKTALQFLRNAHEDIFLILSELNMPELDGLQLKRLIEQIPELKEEAIPFIYRSSSGSDAEIRAAYSLNIQGFFRKVESRAAAVESLLRIIAFWTNCVHPKDLSKAVKKFKRLT